MVQWHTERGRNRVKTSGRAVAYDAALGLEAYRFRGAVQPFPNHFHPYYVIGCVEAGQRTLSCKNQEYLLRKGDLVLFNPGDSHACAQSGGIWDYRGFHITKACMLDLTEEITGRRELPFFSRNVVRDEEAACCLRRLHALVMRGAGSFDREEYLVLLFSGLLRQYGRPFAGCVPVCPGGIERACRFMERHYAEKISLEQLCRCTGLSRSTLLRAFTKEKGVTPYGYLENVRIGKAKKLLEQGVPPAEAALRTGFSDQSHFTNYFSRFIGLPPGAYREIFRDRDSAAERPRKE